MTAKIDKIILLYDVGTKNILILKKFIKKIMF